MKKIVKIIGAASAVALAAGLVPYHFKSDKESGEFELGGLLWNLKKTSGEEEDTYTMELLPFMDKENEQEAVEADIEVDTEAEAAEEDPEEPFAEEVSNDVVVEEVDTKKAADESSESVAQEDASEEEEPTSTEDAQ